MFAIGQFAQVAKVSVRTLRHYDDVGLLRAAKVDDVTGYRSYVAAQLPALNRILVLKDLGFSLAEITRMIEEGVGNDELLGMLRLRQAEAERAVEDERLRLARVAGNTADRAWLAGVFLRPSGVELRAMSIRWALRPY